MYLTVPARRSSRLSAQKAGDKIDMAVAKNGRVDDTGMSAGKKFVKRYVGGERALCALTFWYWERSVHKNAVGTIPKKMVGGT